MAAGNRTVLKNVHHGFGQRFVPGVSLGAISRGRIDEGIFGYAVAGLCNALAIMPLAARDTAIIVKTAR